MITRDSLVQLLNDCPELLTASDLVKMGLYPTQVSIYKDRSRNQAPPCVHLSENKIRFIKSQLIDWLISRNNFYTQKEGI